MVVALAACRWCCCHGECFGPAATRQPTGLPCGSPFCWWLGDQRQAPLGYAYHPPLQNIPTDRAKFVCTIHPLLATNHNRQEGEGDRELVHNVSLKFKTRVGQIEMDMVGYGSMEINSFDFPRPDWRLEKVLLPYRFATQLAPRSGPLVGNLD